jgi:Raf kinase inhibitor-like YbhB/YbcL family protein
MQKLGKALRPIHAGDDKLLLHRLQRGRKPNLDVSSVGFAKDGPIPRHFTQDGDDVSPPLQWGAVPSTTKEIVVVCEDPDAPSTRPYLHWLAHGLSPDVHELREDVEKTLEPSSAHMKQSLNSAKREGYAGPAPPRGHGLHHYHFQVFALDTKLGLDADADRDVVTDAMRGHVVAFGEVVGTYERA